MNSPRTNCPPVSSAEFPKALINPAPAIATPNPQRCPESGRELFFKSPIANCKSQILSDLHFPLIQNRNPMLARVRDVPQRWIALRLHPAAKIGRPSQSQIPHHLMVHFRTAPVGRQIIPDHGTVSPREENPALKIAQNFLATAGHFYFLAGHQKSRDRDNFQ